MARALGVDVSHHQGFINWSTTAQHASFAFIKLTEGYNFIDPSSIENVRNAINSGMLVGGYHFYRPALYPDEQADTFIAELVRWQRHGLHLPAVVDVETGPVHNRDIVVDLEKMFKRLDDALAVKPMLYTATHYYNSNLGESEYLKEFPLWIANWTSAPEPYLPEGRDDWEFWQYSNSGHGPTFGAESQRIDLNYFNGTLEELKEKYPQQDVLKAAYGSPRIDYRRKVHVLPFAGSAGLAHKILDEAIQNKETVGWSVDDACIGNLSDKTAHFWNLSAAEKQEMTEFVEEYYPGTKIVYETMLLDGPTDPEPVYPDDRPWWEKFLDIFKK